MGSSRVGAAPADPLVADPAGRDGTRPSNRVQGQPQPARTTTARLERARNEPGRAEPARAEPPPTADRVEAKPPDGVEAGDAPETQPRPDQPTVPPEVLQRLTTEAADPVRFRALTGEIETARARLAGGGLDVDQRAPLLSTGATLTRDRSWRDIAATAFGVQPEAVTAGQYTLLAGRNPELAQLLARGGDPAATTVGSGGHVVLDHTTEGAQLRAALLEAQARALAGSRETLARGAANDPRQRTVIQNLDAFIITAMDLQAEARVQAGFARLTTQVGEAQRRLGGQQPSTARVAIAEARRELQALQDDGSITPELQRTLAFRSVDLTVLEARTIQPLPSQRGIPPSTRAEQALNLIHTTLERGRASIDDMVTRGVVRPEDADQLRHRLAYEGAEVRADHHVRLGDFTRAREAYVDQLQLSTGMPRERLDHALRSNEGGLYVFSRRPDPSALPALVDHMRSLAPERRNEVIRSLGRIAAAASESDYDTAGRGALRLLDHYASAANDGILFGQNRALAARQAALRGDLSGAAAELRTAMQYTGWVSDASARQAVIQELREQYGNVQLQLAGGAGTYDQRRPAAEELRRLRVEAEGDQGATPDHRARLLLLEAQAYAESSQGAEARRALERLRGLRGEVAWAGERADAFLSRHASDDAGLRVALRELSSETLGEAFLYQGGGMAAGAAVGAAIGVWLGGVGAIPGAAIGAFVGGATGTAALKGRNYLRASRHGAFDSSVVGGISAVTNTEATLNGVSLAFDALAIAAPLRATALLGRGGARALAAPTTAQLGRLTAALDDDIARAFVSAQRTADSLPVGMRRAAIEGQMRELLLRQWTRSATSFGGAPVAAAGLAALAAPVAQQLYDIETSNRSPAEKARDRQRVLSHVAQASLVVGMFGGTNALISRYAARPADVAASLRSGLQTDADHVPLAVGRDDVPERGHGPVTAQVDIDGPNGRLVVRTNETAAPTIVTVGDRRYLQGFQQHVAGSVVMGLRSTDDVNAPVRIVRYNSNAGTWEDIDVASGRARRIDEGGHPRDAVYVGRDDDGVPLLIRANGLARRLDRAGPTGATPDEVARARAMAHPGLFDIDGDRLRLRARLDPDDPLVRDMFYDGDTPPMGRHETAQGPIWMTENGMIDGTGRVYRPMGRSEETNHHFFIDSQDRTIAVRRNERGASSLFHSYGPLDPAMMRGFVPAFNGYHRRGYRDGFNSEAGRYGNELPVRLARQLDDIPERSLTDVDVAEIRRNNRSDDLADLVLQQRNPGTAYWISPEGRAYYTVRENGRAIAFDTNGLPVGTLAPDSNGALRMAPLTSIGEARPILGVGVASGQYFHVGHGPNGVRHYRVVDNGRSAVAALDLDGNAVILRRGSSDVFAEGFVQGPNGVPTSVVHGGRHYNVVKMVDRFTSVVQRTMNGGQTEAHIARLEPGNPLSVVMDPPGVTARANIDGHPVVVYNGRTYDVWSQPETREQWLARLPQVIGSTWSTNAGHARLMTGIDEVRRARALPGEEDSFARDLTAEVRAGGGPILDQLRARVNADPIALLEQFGRYQPDTTTRLIIGRARRPRASDRDISDPHAHGIFVEDGGRIRPATVDEVRADFERRVPNLPPREFSELPRPAGVDLETAAADGSRVMRVRFGDETRELTIPSRAQHDPAQLPTDEQIADWIRRLPAHAARELRQIAWAPRDGNAAATWSYHGGVLTFHALNRRVSDNFGPLLTAHEVAGHGIEANDSRLYGLMLQARMLDLHVHGRRHGTEGSYGDRNFAELFAVGIEEWAARRPGADSTHLRRVLDSMFPRDAAPATPAERQRLQTLLPLIFAGVPFLAEREER